MKKVILGIGMFLGGMLGAGFVFLSVSDHTNVIASIDYDGLTIPFGLSICLILLGLIIAFMGAFGKDE